MRVFQINLSKDNFSKLDDEEIVFFLVFGKFINEISVLIKLYFISLAGNDEDTLENTIGGVQANIISHILAAKLFEGSILITTAWGGKQFSRSILNGEFEVGSRSLKEIRKYFNIKNNPISVCRNKFAFHYDPDPIMAGFNRIESPNDMRIFVQSHHANSLNFVAESAVNLALYEIIDKNSNSSAARRLIDDARNISDHFLDFANEYFPNVLRRMLGEDFKLEDDSSVIVEGAPAIESVTIPFFVDMAGLGSTE